MTEIVQNCPLCGSKANSQFDQRKFRGIPVTNLICQHCGMVYQSPRMNDTERQSFYEQGYRELYQGQESPKTSDLRVQEARAEHIIEFISNPVKSAGRILDIGCSAGILLKHFQNHFHAQIAGVEPGKMHREYARSSGMDVFPSLEELSIAIPGRFDLISMMHVLEHIPEPVGYLQNLRVILLASAGWLLIEVPNLYAHDSFEVAHPISFSSHTLVQTLQQAGYQSVKLKLHGLPRSRLIPLYITVLAHPAPADSEPPLIRKELGVKLKRKLGLSQRRLLERFLSRYAWREP